jgi:pimeloyl-ACP methyl ester carboxylesterase
MHVEIPGARIWCEDTGGAGPALVLLHAGTGSSPLFARQLEAFGKAGYRCIAYDRRGHGKTEATGEAPASEDLHRLAEKLGLGKFHLLGTAAGGVVALDFALSHSSRLRSLAIVNSVFGFEDAELAAIRNRLRPPDAVPVEMRELGPSYRATDPEGARRWLELEHASRAKGIASYPKLKNRITVAAVRDLKIPALLMTGDADLYTPPAVLERYRTAFGDATVKIVPACGHSAFWEQPKIFEREVLAFLEKHR